MKHRLTLAAALVLWPALSPALLAAEVVKAPVDANASATILDAAKSAETSGNYTAAIREYRKLLELYANEPRLQAPVYLAMSADAEKAGDMAQSKLFADVSASLDPALTHKANEQAKAAGTRGGGGKADTFLALAAAALQGYQTYRASRPQQQQPDPSQQYQQQGQYPQAAYGQQGYQQPQQAYAPTPGYGDPNAQQAQGGYPPQQQGGYPQQAQGGYPQQQPQGGGYPQQQPGAYPPQQQGAYPQQQQPGAYPQQQPGAYPQQAQSGYPQQAYPQQAYPDASQQQGAYPQQAPYGAPQGYAQQRTRGAAAMSIKVVYDRSRAGAADRFANACGALLTVEDSNLVFTPGCGEAPRVIPAAEIWEVRPNTVVGREAGAFHVITKKGLYLDVAPPSGDRDTGREYVESLRKNLGLAS